MSMGSLSTKQAIPTMHEASLAIEVIALLERQRNTLSRITRIVLDIGALGCVDEDALRTALLAALPGTLPALHHGVRTARPHRALPALRLDPQAVAERAVPHPAQRGRHAALMQGAKLPTVKYDPSEMKATSFWD